jgi:hypothetical protein
MGVRFKASLLRHQTKMEKAAGLSEPDKTNIQPGFLAAPACRRLARND